MKIRYAFQAKSWIRVGEIIEMKKFHSQLEAMLMAVLFDC